MITYQYPRFSDKFLEKHIQSFMTRLIALIALTKLEKSGSLNYEFKSKMLSNQMDIVINYKIK